LFKNILFLIVYDAVYFQKPIILTNIMFSDMNSYKIVRKTYPFKNHKKKQKGF